MNIHSVPIVIVKISGTTSIEKDLTGNIQQANLLTRRS